MATDKEKQMNFTLSYGRFKIHYDANGSLGVSDGQAKSLAENIVKSAREFAIYAAKNPMGEVKSNAEGMISIVTYPAKPWPAGKITVANAAVLLEISAMVRKDHSLHWILDFVFSDYSLYKKWKHSNVCCHFNESK